MESQREQPVPLDPQVQLSGAVEVAVVAFGRVNNNFMNMTVRDLRKLKKDKEILFKLCNDIEILFKLCDDIEILFKLCDDIEILLHQTWVDDTVG